MLIDSLLPKIRKRVVRLPIANIGQKPTTVYNDVSVSIIPAVNPKPYPKTNKMVLFKDTVVFKGPKGTLSVDIPQGLNVRIEPGKLPGEQLIHIDLDKEKFMTCRKWQRKFISSMWGTCSSLLKQYSIGVLQGFKVPLWFKGIGYRVDLQEPKKLALKIGYCHSVPIKIPDGVEVEIPNPTTIIVSALTLKKACEFAGVIRLKKPPEIYKGKGIYLGDETITLFKKRKKVVATATK